MFANVSRVDLVAETTAGLVLIYTDHRTAAEIAATPELSVLLAVARLCAGRHHFEHHEGKPVAEVLYAVPSVPPPLLRRAVTLAGGIVELTTRERLPPEPGDDDLDMLVGDMFFGLAARVQSRLGERDARQALSVSEQVARLTPMTEDDDALGYWTAVMELAALAGAALGDQVPGRWRMATMQVPPFAFEPDGDSGRLALPCNRAQRFVERGLPADSMLGLLEAFAEVAVGDDGPRAIMPSLRASRERSVGIGVLPLLDPEVAADVEGDVELPLIGFGRDGTHTFALIMGEEFAQRQDAIVAEALRNVRTVEAHLERHQIAGTELIAVSGHYFAAEKLLDPDFMRHLGKLLDTALLAVAVPRRGLLLAVDARPPGGDEVGALTVLFLSATEEFREAGSRAICTTPLLVADGRIVGAAQIEGDPSADDDAAEAEPDDAADAAARPPRKGPPN